MSYRHGMDPALILHEFTCQSCGQPLFMNWVTFHFQHTGTSLCSGGYAVARQQFTQPAVVVGEVIEVTDQAVGIPTPTQLGLAR